MEETKPVCPHCGSNDLKPHGHRKFKTPPLARKQWSCKSCGKHFVPGVKRASTQRDVTSIKSTWKQIIFRCPPELEECLAQDKDSFQQLIESYLAKRYKKALAEKSANAK
jgi:transposase-like protein